MLGRTVLGRQNPAGWWKGELRTNVTMDAEDLLLRQFPGILRNGGDSSRPRAGFARSNGLTAPWANFEGGPADLSTTVEAYVARFAWPAMPLMIAISLSAREWIREHGGLESTRVFTRIWLALFGEWSWDELPTMPPEIVLLPRWLPLKPRTTGAAGPASRSSRSPWSRRCGRCARCRSRSRSCVPAACRPSVVERQRAALPAPFSYSTAVLYRYERSRVKPGRSAVLHRAAEWIIARQEADGGWGGIQPPWVYSILALHLLGLSPRPSGAGGRHPGTGGVPRPRADARRRRAAPVRRANHRSGTPAWRLSPPADAGVPADDPALAPRGERLLGEEIRVRGDWSVRRPDLPPGGWAFEFANDGYPDVDDDTAEVVLALDRLDSTVPAADAIERGVAWVGRHAVIRRWLGRLRHRQHRRLIEKLPFCDFGAVIDPPSAERDRACRQMLAARGLARTEAAQDGVRWLLDAQEPDGSWSRPMGRESHLRHRRRRSGTGRAPESPRIRRPARRAVRWLHGVQNFDGGWGEDLRSYDDASWRGRGASTASQTAWALLALLAAGDEARRGRPRDQVVGGYPAGRRRVGRIAVHRHRLSPRLLHQL